MSFFRFLTALLGWGFFVFAYAIERQAPVDGPIPNHSNPDGVVFSCTPDELAALPAAMSRYLRELGIDRDRVIRTESANGTLSFTLDTPVADTNTLNFKDRRAWHLPAEKYRLLGPAGQSHWVWTVSRQEILLTLLQHGRQTVFSGKACAFQALREHVALRQNMVAWAEHLKWVWPDGEKAKWNEALWNDGTPLSLHKVDEALADALWNQNRYSIGCYTAIKISLSHGILDFYQRVLRHAVKTDVVRQRLIGDGDPLVDLEPQEAWSFEADFDVAHRNPAGKLLRLVRSIPSQNFVPGDWAYFVNTDPTSSLKVGYEGSNALYLGRGKFADFYDDHHHSYTFTEKIDEVYQWRNGVFSRSRDAAKIRPLSPNEIAKLGQTPDKGGLLLDWRLVPYFFGFQDLPPRLGRSGSLQP